MRERGGDWAKLLFQWFILMTSARRVPFYKNVERDKIVFNNGIIAVKTIKDLHNFAFHLHICNVNECKRDLDIGKKGCTFVITYRRER